MRPVLPALAYYFGIRWDDIYSMPRGELDAYLGELAEINREATKHGRGQA